VSRPYEDADALRVCLETALSNRPNPPAATCFRTGQYALLDAGSSMNDCCDGLAWVRIVSIDPVTEFGTTQTNPCAGGYQVTYELGVARCQPFGDERSGIDCDTWAALALQIDDDAEAMRSAVCCFTGVLGADAFDMAVALGSWAPMDTEGGCTGGTTQVTVTYNRLESS